ncbi:MAG TPA: Spo0B domain-containing protein [Symbiobacteriaceae bacterium]|nr:Spo0B domain-containing protein [Symbiobacteriaceae bacterium]
MDDQLSAKRAMNLVRRQRHSFLNHLQVISGWLQLGQPERARRYLDTIAGRMSAESEVIRRAPAALGHLMLELGLVAETHGVELEWRLSEAPACDLENIRQAVMQALPASTAPPEAARLVVLVTAGGASVHRAPFEREG